VRVAALWAVLWAGALLVVGCVGHPPLSRDEERVSIAALLGIAPDLLKFEIENPDKGLKPGRIWCVVAGGDPGASAAVVFTYRSVLTSYTADSPAGWIRHPVVPLSHTTALTRDEAISGARELVRHFWPSCAPYVGTSAVVEAHLDNATYLVRLELPAVTPLSPQKVMIRFDPKSGACEHISGHDFPTK
jgi:hypothetical protein